MPIHDGKLNVRIVSVKVGQMLQLKSHPRLPAECLHAGDLPVDEAQTEVPQPNDHIPRPNVGRGAVQFLRSRQGKRAFVSVNELAPQRFF